jgi:hypothetical protein
MSFKKTNKSRKNKKVVKKTYKRKTINKRKSSKQRGGDCGCAQKLFNGGYGPASFQGNVSDYKNYEYNMRNADPTSPDKLIASRNFNLSGGKKQKGQKGQKGGLFFDLLSKNNSSDMATQFGTSTGSMNTYRLLNNQTLGNDGAYPVKTTVTKYA